MIGFAPPLPQFRNLPEYISVVEFKLKGELSRDEIQLAAEARGAKISALDFADWLTATRACLLMPASSPLPIDQTEENPLPADLGRPQGLQQKPGGGQIEER